MSFKVIAAAIGLAIASAVSIATAGAAAEERPNLVVFLIDDMGLMDTSVPFLTDAKGQPQRHPLNDYYRTPNMERLAAQGIRFSTFYAQSVCSPSRISILTGQSSARHRTTTWIRPQENNRGAFGPQDWRWTGLDRSSVTLPRLLQAAGYRTIHVGKGHFAPFDREGEDPRDLGFDVNIGGHGMGQPGSYYGEKNYGNRPDRDNDNTPGVPHLEEYHGTDTFLTEALTIEANQEIDSALAADEPFFLYFPHYAVHGPHQSDPRFAAHYVDSGKPKPAQAYATLIEGMDKSLGDVLDHINRIGQGERTLVIFLGDNGSDAPLGKVHGYASSAPLRGKKGTCYEGGTRVPFIAAWAAPDPGTEVQRQLPIAAGVIQQQMGTVMDLFPTLLEVARVASPAGHPVDGVNLKRQLAGQRDEQRPERFLSHFPHEHRSSYFTAYRDGDWKVIYRYLPPDQPHAGGKAVARERAAEADEPQERYELYDLAADPYETANLAAERPDRLRGMMEALLGRLEEEDALYPVDAAGDEIRPVVP